jgi:phage-related holin
MDTLSPLNYTIAVCKVSPWQAIVSLCFTATFFLFGDDLTALIIALIMLSVDTVLGTLAAIIEQSRTKQTVLTSREFWRVIPKFVAIVSAFIVGNLLAIFQPGVGDVLEYGIASVIIVAEAGSILENVGKIHPEFSMKGIIHSLKKLVKYE